MRYSLLFAWTFLHLVLFTHVTDAANPRLNQLIPTGGQRGTEVVVLFDGNNLKDFQEVQIYYPGIVVTKTEAVNDNQFKVTLKIDPNCRLGEHGFRVRTATGLSDFRTFWVGALPVVEEKEPNSEFTSPQPIAVNTTVAGRIDNEDVDYYVVELKKGQRLSAEVEGNRLGRALFDPYVAILDAKRFELASNDDSSILGQDCGCSIIAPEDGKYYVQVRETSYSAGNLYRLHVGHFPRPTAMIPAGGKPGEELELRFIGDPSGEIRQKIKLPASDDPTFRVHCTTPEGMHPAGFKFHVVDAPNLIETANWNDQSKPGMGTAPGAFNGIISAANETDYIKFAAKKGQVFDIRCHARRLGSPLDPVLHVSIVGGAYLTGNDDSGNPDSYIRFTAPEDKEYFVFVHDHLRKGGPDYFYRIEILPIQPEIITSIPKVDGNNVSNQDRQMISVPKGGRYAALIRTTRKDLGGPLQLSTGPLPNGVTATHDATVDPNVDVMPVVFEAKPDAANASALLDIKAVHTDPNVKAISKNHIDVCFNIGQNNTPFWRHDTYRTAMAITNECPYSIEVVQSKVPLVQRGVANLKVVVKRAAGFKGAINVYPLWNPPGVGIQGAITIPENANEGLLNMNAAPNAMVKKWKTALIANATVGNGPVWTSSQLFDLDVAPSYMEVKMERGAVEQGKDAKIFVKPDIKKAFEGNAKIRLIGLPPKTATQELQFNKDTKEIAFPIKVEATAPAGIHRNIFCQIEIPESGELIVHNLGGTELRIDVPIPPKPNEQPKPMVATPAPMPMPQPNAPPMKRLSRLEQLRLEQEEREKAAKSGTPEPKK